MATAQYVDELVLFAHPTGDYCRPDWTAELRRIEALILATAAGITWS
jgi:hypothetical protein